MRKIILTREGDTARLLFVDDAPSCGVFASGNAGWAVALCIGIEATIALRDTRALGEEESISVSP